MNQIKPLKFQYTILIFKQNIDAHSHNEKYKVFYIIFTQNKYRIIVKLYNSAIKGLYNTALLFCHTYTSSQFDALLKIGLINFSVHGNVGNALTNMIVVLIDGEFVQWCTRDSASKTIFIHNSKFYNNSNIQSVIAIDNFQKSVARCKYQIVIVDCSFIYGTL